MTSVDVDYPYGEEPFASFIFKYRSRRMFSPTSVERRANTNDDQEIFKSRASSRALHLHLRSRSAMKTTCLPRRPVS